MATQNLTAIAYQRLLLIIILGGCLLINYPVIPGQDAQYPSSMALIQIEVTGLQVAWCRYCAKSDLVVMWCSEQVTASLVAVSGARDRYVWLSICGGLVGVSKSMQYNPDKGYLLPIRSSHPFRRYTWLASKFTANLSSHSFPTDMGQQSSIAGRTCMKHAANENCWVGKRAYTYYLQEWGFVCNHHPVSTTIHHSYRVYIAAGNYMYMLIIFF